MNKPTYRMSKIGRGDQKMPQIDEIRKGKEIGKKNKTAKFIWHGCVLCGNTRWVQFTKDGQPRNLHCSSCQSKAAQENRKYEKHPRWKGGVWLDHDYITIKLKPNDPYYQMTNKRGYVRLHRLIVAQHLGKCLTRTEIVHHLNGDKQDNRLENLKLIISQEHKTSYNSGYIKGFLDGLETNVKSRQGEVVLDERQIHI